MQHPVTRLWRPRVCRMGHGVQARLVWLCCFTGRYVCHELNELSESHELKESSDVTNACCSELQCVAVARMCVTNSATYPDFMNSMSHLNFTNTSSPFICVTDWMSHVNITNSTCHLDFTTSMSQLNVTNACCSVFAVSCSGRYVCHEHCESSELHELNESFKCHQHIESFDHVALWADDTHTRKHHICIIYTYEHIWVYICMYTYMCIRL